MQFKRDIVIDLICYRRRGHNEADEPSGTQPLMYQKIAKQRTTRELYADSLIQSKVLDDERSEEHTSELQSLMRISYAVFCLKKKNHTQHTLQSPYTISI